MSAAGCMRTMRVGLNMLFLIPGWVGGTERYATALLRALARLDSTPSSTCS